MASEPANGDPRPTVNEPVASPNGRSRAPFTSTVALTVTLTIGAFGVALPAAYLLIPPIDPGATFPPQNQTAETLLFILTFAVLLPLALLMVPRLTDRIAAGANADALPVLSAALAALLVAGVGFIRLSARLPIGDGLETLLVVMLLWSCVAAAVLGAAATRPLRLDDRIAGLAGAIWWGTAVLAFLAIVGFAHRPSVSLLPAAVGAALAAALIIVRRRWAPPELGRGWGWAADVTLAALVFLAVPNLVVFETGTPDADFVARIIQFHQGFFLGPANHVIGGGYMLVDTLSQYGVGSIYALAAWFQVAPIGYGTLALFEGLLTACVFTAAYVVLRVAGLSRILSAGAMLVALVVLVYGLSYPLGALLQHGSIRFGLPMGVIVAAVFAARWPRHAGISRVTLCVILGISSIWALEAFAYSLLTIASVVALDAYSRPASERWRTLVRWIVQLFAACVTVHLLFALGTLVASGELPDWGLYLNTLRAFLVGKIGELTYDFTPWSPGIAVGALYVASLAGIVLLLLRKRSFVVANWPAIVALAATTAYGVALFSYFVNRSADHILPYVCLPAVMAGALWLGLLLRSTTPVTRAIREGGLAVALAVSVLLISVAWSGAGARFSQAAPALLAPGGSSLGESLSRLWDLPPLSPGGPEGVRLLNRYMPDEHEPLVLTSADLGIEILAETGRINRVPLSDPWEDSFVPEQHLDALAETVEDLAPGDRILLDAPALAAYRGYLREPDRDPLTEPFGQEALVPTGITILQEWVLKEIGERYRLVTIAKGTDGLSVVELEPR